MSTHTARVEQPRIAFEGLLDSAQHRLTQWSTKPSLFRGGKTQLVAPLADFLRQDSTHRAAKHALRVAAHDLVPVTQTNGEFNDTMIENGTRASMLCAMLLRS